MMSGNGTLPAARYLAALHSGMTPEDAYNAAYPTPALNTHHTLNTGDTKK